MLTGPYFKPFVGMLDLSKYSFALPYRWNPKTRQLYITQSKLANFLFSLGALVSVSYIVVLGQELFFNFSRLKPATSMILILWLVINVSVSITKLVIIKWGFQLKEFFNLMIQFEDKYFGNEKEGSQKGEAASAETSVLIVLQLTCVTVAAFPLATTGYICLKPCSRPFLTSFILRCENESELTWGFQVARLVLAVLEGTFWFHVVGMAAFMLCFVLFLSLKCLTKYLVDLAKMNIFDIGLPHYYYRQSTIFRQIQVLHTVINTLMRGQFLPSCQFSWMGMTILGLYATIRMHDKIGLPLYLLFPMIAIDGNVFFYVLIGAASQTYSQSYHLLRNVWRVRKPGRYAKWFLTFRRSCPLLKTHVSNVAFLDKMTPLILIHFCLAQTASLILIQT